MELEERRKKVGTSSTTRANEKSVVHYANYDEDLTMEEKKAIYTGKDLITPMKKKGKGKIRTTNDISNLYNLKSKRKKLQRKPLQLQGFGLSPDEQDELMNMSIDEDDQKWSQ